MLTYDLYPYQMAGYERFMERGSLLLAFDMGLGKTFTAIAIAENLLETRKVRRVMLVVPANLKYQWAKSIAKFVDVPTYEKRIKDEALTIPTLDCCVVVDGAIDRRAKQWKAARTADYVIVGYDQVATDAEYIASLDIGYVVLDEASLIKSPGTKRSKAVKKHLRVPYRLALTGTPIENRPEEVFSIMQWVDAEVLGRFDLFDKSYIERNPWGGVESYKHLDVLHEKLSEAMVRKTREDPDVAPFMPDVLHELWTVEMDSETEESYKEILADLLLAYDKLTTFGGKFDVAAHYGQSKGDRRGDKTAMGRLMSVHETAQALLNHPTLVAHSANMYKTTDDKGSKYAADLMDRAFRLPTTSPKLDFTVAKVNRLLASGRATKILIFTKYVGMLTILERDLDRLGITSVKYSGQMNAAEKEAAVSKFSRDDGVQVFLSSHAGAYGTDMPMADWLINYDLPDASGKAKQINARHVRASSDFENVHVRDIVVKDSIEMRKLARLVFKDDISDAIIDGAGSGTLSNEVETLHSHAVALLDIELAGAVE